MTGKPRSFGVRDMRHRCTVQSVVETQDSAGQPVVSYSDVFVDEPCQFLPTDGVEIMRGRQLVSNVKATFRVRYRDGYTPTMSILFNGNRYGITNINQVDGLRRYIELTCKS